jgi:Protein of unknown function (DUF4446)
VDELSSTQGIVALAAAATALIALIWAAVNSLRLRRLRAEQRTLLGEDQTDLVSHAATLQEAFVQLRDLVEETASRVDERMSTAEQRIDGCVAHTSLVRYDAYGDLSGRQSSSVALLDARRTGVVLSSILHRDQARVYVKQVHEGTSELEAMDAAMAGAPAIRTPAGA